MADALGTALLAVADIFVPQDTTKLLLLAAMYIAIYAESDSSHSSGKSNQEPQDDDEKRRARNMQRAKEAGTQIVVTRIIQRQNVLRSGELGDIAVKDDIVTAPSPDATSTFATPLPKSSCEECQVYKPFYN